MTVTIYVELLFKLNNSDIKTIVCWHFYFLVYIYAIIMTYHDVLLQEYLSLIDIETTLCVYFFFTEFL